MTTQLLKTPLMILSVFLLSGCHLKDKKKDKEDSPLKGTIYISADESFKPVIEEQIRVYEQSYPGTQLIASYKPEADCLKDFFRDTLNRLVIVTRGLSDREDDYMFDSLNYHPAWDRVATDAITVLVNAGSSDTLFTMERLKQQLTGKLNPSQPIVFDGLNATSAVRFVTDSILRGEKFDTSVVKAARNSTAVIDYVSTHKDAIGLVGISWIGNPEDTQMVNRLKQVKMAYIQCEKCNGTPYVKPVQASIVSGRYPLVRGLYYITKENYFGLGTSFVNFMRYERGQLVFRRAYLAPVMDFGIRNVRLNTK